MIDYYSKYIGIGLLPEITSKSKINVLKSSFGRYGIPKIVQSDRGTQYTRTKFSDFKNAWDFKYVISSARYPQSNGMVEIHIQTVNRIFGFIGI